MLATLFFVLLGCGGPSARTQSLSCRTSLDARYSYHVLKSRAQAGLLQKSPSHALNWIFDLPPDMLPYCIGSGATSAECFADVFEKRTASSNVALGRDLMLSLEQTELRLQARIDIGVAQSSHGTRDDGVYGMVGMRLAK